MLSKAINFLLIDPLAADFTPLQHKKRFHSICSNFSKNRVMKAGPKMKSSKLQCCYLSIKTFFSKNDDDLSLTNLAEHKIEMTNSKPIKQPFRRVPLAFVNEEKQAIDKLLKQGVIRPSNSPWASPLCLVRKKDGSVRPCVDYRQINLQIRPDAFPVPKIDECIDALSGAKIFSTIDMTSSYLQVPVREEDNPKTAFISKHGLYEFTSMPFGMINSGATFQRIMELAMKGCSGRYASFMSMTALIFHQPLMSI